MRKLTVGLVAFLMTAAACAGGSSERTVLVDYSHDEFASFIIANFPSEVAVAPGSTVVFKQIWTGEPHTVTGGKLVDEMMDKAKYFNPFFESYEAMLAADIGLPDPEAPSGSLADLIETVEESGEEPNRTKFLDAYDGLVESGSKLPPRDDTEGMSFEEANEIIDKETEAIFESATIPWALDENEEGAFVTQNAGQPCFLTTGAPPKKASTPCKDQQQRQPEFDGTATYYNSGIIPYEGPQGNTFKVELADDIDPGSYFFYCAVHGPSQYTELKVQEDGADVPSEEDVSRQARKEATEITEPMAKLFKDASDGEIEVQGEKVEGPFAGLSPEVHGSINEFLPKTIKTKVGEEVTWKSMGSDHTITFDVPEYFPIIQFAKNGKVALNPKLEPPAGGSPDIPEQDGPPGEGPPEDGPPEILKVDGGTYDGSGFWSSGLFGGQPYAEYTLRFSKAGTYKYACLLHPPMVGTVEVT